MKIVAYRNFGRAAWPNPPPEQCCPKCLDCPTALCFTGRWRNRVQRCTIRAVIAILIGAFSLSLAPVARSQYTTNFQDAIISGVTSNWSGSYIVGSNTFADILFVQNGGMLADGNGYLGYEASGSNNVAAVIDSGSVWSNADNLYVGNSGANNFLWIADGGAVVASNSYLGYNSTSSNNEVLVSGSGSVWSNSGDLTVGYYGSSNTLTITNGGVVYSNGGYIGYFTDGGNNNVVTVSGSGSVWSNSGFLSFGASLPFGGNLLVVAEGGAVYSSGAGGYGANVVVTGAGSVWNNSGGFDTGDIEFGDGGLLTIADGGAVYDSGYFTWGGSVLVTGNGSVWSNAGSLVVHGELSLGMTISNGAAVYSSGADLASDGTSFVVVTGPGSVWNNTGSLDADGYGFRLTIANGGAVRSGDTFLTGQTGASALVTGVGSIWSIGGSLTFAHPAGLVIAGDGAVVADSVSVSYAIGINIAGGGMYVTNALGTGVLQIDGGTLSIDVGTVTADQLVFSDDNGASTLSFMSGLLTSGGTFVTNGQNFVIGDGTDVATFHLAGGFHSFADGLMVNSSAFVTGCGTIDGSVVVDPGGTALANCGGSLTFTGIVINNGTLRASNGSVLEFYGPVVNNGLIDLSGGMAIFHSVFINNGSIIEPAPAFQITGIVQQANNILITWMSSPGETNELQATPGGPGGSYSTNNFTPIFAVTNTVGSVTNYLDIGAATNNTRYYRVRLVP